MGLKSIHYFRANIGFKTKTIDLKEITILIPFRDERENLPGLLNSISLQKPIKLDFIFIDDHSEDDSASLIQEFIKEQKTGTLLTLTDGEGKKDALLRGVEHVTTNYILTLDADVVLGKDYIKHLAQLSRSDLIALPVIMKGKSLFGKVFSVEYLFFNAFNYLLASVYPISVSGANLLYNKKFLDYSNQLKEHQGISSGDDYFLLKELRHQKGEICVSNNFNLSVKTQAPENLKDYFQQRVRWLSKTKHKITLKEFLIGLFISLYFFGGFYALIFSLIQLDFKIFWSVFVLRLGLDSFVFINYAQPLKRTKDLLYLPIFQLVYPLLMLTVYFKSLYFKPTWKGRQVK